MWQSSNPALNNRNAFPQDTAVATFGDTMFSTGVREKSTETTLEGVVNKTFLLVGMTVLAGAGGYALSATMPSIVWVSSIAAFILGLAIFFVLGGKPALAPVVAPIYAVVEGVFLGALTALADQMLLAKGLKVMGGVGLQAFIITFACAMSVLGLYKMKVIRPNKTLAAIISTACAALAFTYLASFVLMFFGIRLPFITMFSAMNETGGMAWIGLGINLFVLGLASLTLVMDLGQVEQAVAARSPKYMEWYCGFALLVTLAWIYYEALKLVVRVAILLGNRK